MDVEILIIDDGSAKDNTLEIAKEYETKYNNICRAIHKENGGHGSVLNVGIKEATGVFLKVVDSDDWISTDVGLKLLKIAKENIDNNKNVDLYITNFIYDKVGQTNKKVMSYKSSIKENVILTWNDMNKWTVGHYLLMHSLMYKTEVLRKSGLVLPEKTFYVDNIFAYVPLQYVNNIYYLNENLYHYYIGRDDQSVNETIMISRLLQQYRVTYKMLDDVDLMSIDNKNMRNYLFNYMSIIMTVTSILSIKSNDPHWLSEKEKLWEYVKNKNINVYKKLRYSFLGTFVNLKGRIGRSISIALYKISQKLYGFN